MKLYQLTAQHEELRALTESGELSEQDVADTIEALSGEFDDKAVSTAIIIKEMDAEANAIASAIKEMDTRKRALKARADWLKNYLSINMAELKITSIKNPIMPIKVVKNNPAVEISDEEVIPTKYIHYENIKKIDKKSISEALKGGEYVSGCALRQSTRLKLG